MRRSVAHTYRAVGNRSAVLSVVAKKDFPAGKYFRMYTTRAPSNSGVLWHCLIADIQKQ